MKTSRSMSPAFSRLIPDRRRATSFVLALVVEALIIIALLLWGPRIAPRQKSLRAPTSFSLLPSDDDRAATRAEHRSTAKTSAKAAAAPPPKPQIVPPMPQPTPTPAFTLPGVIPLSLADNDIGKMHGTAPQKGEGDDAGDSKLAYGPGEGPGGAPLYYAEWYREPTHAELSTYMPANGPPTGFALIACKTVAGYHVDNCRVLGETPGSGFGRAMRRAAWQFLVRPPRLGGKTLVGAWVRIRIDFTPSGVSASG